MAPEAPARPVGAAPGRHGSCQGETSNLFRPSRSIPRPSFGHTVHSTHRPAPSRRKGPTRTRLLRSRTDNRCILPRRESPTTVSCAWIHGPCSVIDCLHERHCPNHPCRHRNRRHSTGDTGRFTGIPVSPPAPGPDRAPPGYARRYRSPQLPHRHPGCPIHLSDRRPLSGSLQPQRPRRVKSASVRYLPDYFIVSLQRPRRSRKSQPSSPQKARLRL